jgi:GntR family transcriptional regulator
MKAKSERGGGRRGPTQILRANLGPEAADHTDPIFAMSNATPMYVQLILLFRQRIDGGKWPIGSKIPVLDELVAEFRVARATIRQALNFLEREGLITRSRGRGTFITAKPHGQLFMDIPNSWRKIVKQSKSVVGDWANLSVPLPNLNEIKGGTLAPKYYVMRRVLSWDSVPYMHGTSSLDQRLIDEIGMDWLKRLSIFEFIDRSRKFKVAGGTQSIHIGRADAEISYLLHILLNSPIVILRRAFFDRKSTLIYQSEGILRGDFVCIKRRLTMSGEHRAALPRQLSDRVANAKVAGGPLAKPLS